jgi:hypothetical protein
MMLQKDQWHTSKQVRDSAWRWHMLQEAAIQDQDTHKQITMHKEPQEMTSHTNSFIVISEEADQDDSYSVQFTHSVRLNFVTTQEAMTMAEQLKPHLMPGYSIRVYGAVIKPTVTYEVVATLTSPNTGDM